MGDTFDDPVDHERTTRSHAGESMTNVRSWPGHLLIFASVIATFRCLTALATGHSDRAMVVGAIAVLMLASGLAWVMLEYGRVRRVEDRWHLAHPHVPRQRPTG